MSPIRIVMANIPRVQLCLRFSLSRYLVRYCRETVFRKKIRSITPPSSEFHLVWPKQCRRQKFYAINDVLFLHHLSILKFSKYTCMMETFRSTASARTRLILRGRRHVAHPGDEGVE